MENNGQGPMFIRGPTPLMQAHVTTVWSHTTTAWEVVLEPLEDNLPGPMFIKVLPLKSNSVVPSL